jgi:Family of unknown function (DUF5317)
MPVPVHLKRERRALLPILVVAVSLVGALLAGGRLRGLEQTRLRWWPLAPIGVAMQLVPLPSSPGRPLSIPAIALILSFPVLMAFAAKNYRVSGVWLIILGLTLNFAVIAVNGGMPVSSAAVRSAGAPESSTFPPHMDSRHHVMTEDDELTVLGDAIPIPFLGDVLSVGDVLIYSGLAWALIGATRAPIRRTASPARPAPPPRGYRGKHRPSRRPPPGSPVRLHPAAAGRWGTGR